MNNEIAKLEKGEIKMAGVYSAGDFCLSGSSAERRVTGDCQRSETDIRLLTGLRPLPLFMETLQIGDLPNVTCNKQQKKKGTTS